MQPAERPGRGRPAKTLEQRVCEGAFLARKHDRLLLSEPLVPWLTLAAIQKTYRRARSPQGRRSAALAFERAVRDLDIVRKPGGR